MTITDRESKLDIIVGQNIRAQRTAAGISQRALGSALGITFQQVQKVEQGKNRIGAGRLALVAEILKCPLDLLYAHTPDGKASAEAAADVVDLSLINRLNTLDPQLQAIVRKLINQLVQCNCQTGRD